MISLFILRLRWVSRNAPAFPPMPACRQLVSQFRARHGQRDFQCLAIFSVVAFTPLMGWLAQYHGWQSGVLLDGRDRPDRGSDLWAIVDSPAAS